MNYKKLNINKISIELLHIMSGLSLLDSCDRVILIYINALNTLLSEISINFDSGPVNNCKLCLEIRTQNKFYGTIYFNGNVEILEKELIDLLQKSVTILAVILQRIEYQEMLSTEKVFPRQLVDEKTDTIENNIEMFKSLSENSPDIIFRFDKDLHCLYTNKKFSSVFSEKFENIKGRCLKDTQIPDSLKEELLNEINKVIKKKNTVTKIIFSSSNEKIFEFRFIPEIIESNQVLTILGYGRDITDKFKMEKELIVSKEKVEQSDKLKLAFITNISHEIRTPLNGIIGFARLLTKKNIPPDKRNNYLKIIELSTDNLLRTMSNILEISKIESGEFKIIKEDININEIIKDFYEEYDLKCKEWNKSTISFEIEIPSTDIITVNTDEYRLREVLFNLVDNAFKFTREGFIKIGYYIEHNNIIFFIKDSGIGIKKNNLELIFNRFFQVDYSERKEYGGLGLGLTISKAIIEKLGGKIWIESIYKKGTTIYFNLPLHKSKDNIKRNKSLKYGFIKAEK